MPFELGEGYTSQELSNLQVALLDSGYFSQVQVSPRWNDSEEHHVPVDVKSTANYRNQYQYGVGYGTDTGARVSASLNRRWVNSEGHQLRGMTQVSQIESRIGANYIIPGKKPQSDYYRFKAENDAVVVCFGRCCGFLVSKYIHIPSPTCVSVPRSDVIPH